MKNKLRALGRSFLLDVGLRGKLLCIFFLLLVLPLGVFTLYAFHRINTVIEEQTYSAAQKAFDDTHTAVEDLLGRLTQVADVLTMDPSLYALAASDSTDTTYIQRLEDRDRISTTFTYLRSMSGVDRIRLYVSNAYPYTNSADIVSLDSVQDSEWFRSFREGSVVCWFGPADFADQPESEQGWYSLMRLIYDPSHVQEPLAILRVDISAERVDAAVSRSTITRNGTVLLLDGGEVLSASSADRAETLSSSMPASAAGWVEVDTPQGPCRAQTVALENCGWTLAAALPRDDIFRTSRKLRLEMLVVVVVLAAASYFLAYRLSQSITRRLYRLNDTMHAVELGDVYARVTPQGRDEIGQLMHSFSNMMTRIDTLMDEKLEQGQQIKALELKALQAQINPHFLYNTLDSIAWMCEQGRNADAVNMVHALARLFRISISRGHELIPVAREIEHAESYLQIQKYRYKNQFTYAFDVDPECLEYLCNKITLQPIIENAINHGLDLMVEEGHIDVQVKQDGGDIVFRVIDNGVGMSGEQIEAVLQRGPSDRTGIGIKNVNDRLKIYFGRQYGLHITSELDEGTCVELRMPKVREGEYETK